MSKLILPKATTSAREAATPVEGEVFYDQNNKKLYYGDGATAGGVQLYPASLGAGYVYGIDHDTAVHTAASACKKVVAVGDTIMEVEGNFSSMPAHNFKRCVMSDLANRVVNYYLNASDSTKKENGNPAVLTGADGDVMVEIPVTHWRIDTYTDLDSHVHNRYLVSDRPFIGSSVHPYFYVSPGGATARVQYVGAFKAILCDADGNIKPWTDAQTPGTYAGGDKFRSILGEKPAPGLRHSNYLDGAGAAGGSVANFLFYRYLALMMAIEGGTFDSQATFSYGFAGLGARKTGAQRLPGRTVIFGNGTGEIVADDAGLDADLLTMGDAGVSLWPGNPISKVVQFSYRGIEDAYGAIGQMATGLQARRSSTDPLLSGYWMTQDTSKYSLLNIDQGGGGSGSVFPTSGYSGPSLAWVSHAWGDTQGYIKTFTHDTLLPLLNNGSATLGLTDGYIPLEQAESKDYPSFGGNCAYDNRVGINSVLLTKFNTVSASLSSCSRISA